MEKIPNNNQQKSGPFAKLKNMIGLGVLAGAAAVAGAPATSSTIEQGNLTAAAAEEDAMVRKTTSEVREGVSQKFAQELAAKNIGDVEILRGNSSPDGTKETFTIYLNDKDTRNAVHIIQVELDKSLANNKYAMKELIEGAVAGKLGIVAK